MRWLALIVTLTTALPSVAPDAVGQAGKTPRIGYLLAAADVRNEAFRKGLRKLGYTDGQNIIMERRYFGGAADRLPALAAELVRLPVVLFSKHIRRIVELAMAHRLPTITGNNLYAATGLLVSYGPSYSAMFERTAFYVDRILKGAKPADLPVEEPAIFELVVNLKTARALGLTVPPLVLARANQVIE